MFYQPVIHKQHQGPTGCKHGARQRRDRKDKDQFTAAAVPSNRSGPVLRVQVVRVEGDGEEREKRGSRSWWEERGWEGEGVEGQREGLERDRYTQTHRERDRDRIQRKRRERKLKPTRWSQREDAAYYLCRQQGWGEQDLGWVQERNTHAPSMFTQSDWGDRAVKSDHSERKPYCRAEHGRCRGLERE